MKIRLISPISEMGDIYQTYCVTNRKLFWEHNFLNYPFSVFQLFEELDGDQLHFRITNTNNL